MAINDGGRTAAIAATLVFAGGFLTAETVRWLRTRYRRGSARAEALEKAHNVIWDAISGAMSAAQLYIGDRLGLYAALKELCDDGRTASAADLAAKTKLNQRWLREWMAQQAAAGVLVITSGTEDDALQYRFSTREMAEVLAQPESLEYDISMVQMVPTLVNRAKTMLPQAFKTGIGVAYDDDDVSEAIDRAHSKHVRDVLIPTILPLTPADHLLRTKGARCADLGSGAGNLVIALARHFPEARIEGFEISDNALAQAVRNIRQARLPNASVIDARTDSLGSRLEQYDVVTTYDVLHDATDPADLARQAFCALKPNGVWILGDITALASVRENVEKNPGAKWFFAVSTCLCMACGLSKPDGRGLGTLGFSVPVAMQLLTDAGFKRVSVLREEQSTRWFLAAK